MASGNLGPDACPSISYPTLRTEEKEGLNWSISSVHQRSRRNKAKVGRKAAKRKAGEVE